MIRQWNGMGYFHIHEKIEWGGRSMMVLSDREAIGPAKRDGYFENGMVDWSFVWVIDNQTTGHTNGFPLSNWGYSTTRNPNEGCPFKVGDKVKIVPKVTLELETDGGIGFLETSMSKFCNTIQTISEIIPAKGIGDADLFKFSPSGWAWSPLWATKVGDNELVIPTPVLKSTKEFVCPRIGCEYFQGVDIMGATSFEASNSCPKCGFPGLLPRVGWCQHKKLRMGYTGKIMCMADNCGAEFQCTSSYAFKPNTIFYRVKHKTRSVLDSQYFYVTLDMKQNPDHKALLENLRLEALNDLAKPPASGWVWPKSTDDLSF